MLHWSVHAIALIVCVGHCMRGVVGEPLKFKPKSTFVEDEFEQDVLAGEADAGVHWAIIVAGSNGYYNYRHQADICHAYHIMLKHGIPAERIVTMMYDDIANAPENPTRGIIINHPNGTDVYKGVVIDYKGEDVTPQNFLAALSGRAELLANVGSGKVIKSGPNDHIFVNFADHGAPGLIAFPTSELLATDLMKTIKSMYQNKQYGQMVLYIEACESGSMFSNLLPKNINVYATTAANPSESSYACYWDDKRQTYLGDVYSVNWMEDSDKENLDLETLHKQFMIVKQETNTSHCMEYGDSKIGQEVCDEFQGTPGYKKPEPIILPKVPYDAVPSEQVRLATLYRRLSAAKDKKQQELLTQEINDLLALSEEVDKTMKNIVGLSSRDLHQSDRLLRSRYELTAYDCYEPAVELFDERCFDISQNDYALRRLFLLVNLCEERVPVETILESIAKVCKK